MTALLEGKVAVVTGAASGIGRAIAVRFAEHGADVVVADVRREPRQADRPTTEVIESDTDAAARFVECDVTDMDDLEATMATAVELGGLDVMVNNAAVYWRKPAMEVTEDEFDELFAVNVKGTFFGAQLAAAAMDDGGVILNVSSVAGLNGAGGEVPYSASKGAVTLLTYGLAAELGERGIRVNSIHPGMIRTALHTENTDTLATEAAEAQWAEIPALKRLGDPGDVADAALLLASDYARYISGTPLTVDGGWTNLVAADPRKS
ncbi:SDR family oxidoreductase [Halomicroarcula sp. GCM10025817]|uniref:SDR family oxidoreductase n=1 Tax=Haloarcula TaxID=2237 RepID=UPI0023E7D109|nr:SDR family oxidoreductase [Halomicroarcula sp. SYNS111]